MALVDLKYVLEPEAASHRAKQCHDIFNALCGKCHHHYIDKHTTFMQRTIVWFISYVYDVIKMLLCVVKICYYEYTLALTHVFRRRYAQQ